MGERPQLFRIKEFTNRNPCFSEATIRDIVFKSKPRRTSRGVIPGNGFDKAIVRLGGNVYIDESKWFVCMQEQNAENGGTWEP